MLFLELFEKFLLRYKFLFFIFVFVNYMINFFITKDFTNAKLGARI